MPTQIQVRKRIKRLRLRGPLDSKIAISHARRRFTLPDLLKEMKPGRQHKLEDDAPRGAERIEWAPIPTSVDTRTGTRNASCEGAKTRKES